jgi:hypothetical protein
VRIIFFAWMDSYGMDERRFAQKKASVSEGLFAWCVVAVLSALLSTLRLGSLEHRSPRGCKCLKQVVGSQ